MNRKSFTPSDWFWVVAGDDARFWSSAAGAYVTELPEGAGVSRIVSELELSDVLRQYGLAVPRLALADYKAAFDAHLDQVSQQKQYDNRLTIAAYISSTHPQWAAEAETFIAWRDACLMQMFSTLAAVEAGEIEPPTIEDFIAGMPAIDWPA